MPKSLRSCFPAPALSLGVALLFVAACGSSSGGGTGGGSGAGSAGGSAGGSGGGSAGGAAGGSGGGAGGGTATTWSTPTQLDANDPGVPQSLTIVADASGNVTVAWSSTEVFVARFSGGAWSAAMALSANAGTTGTVEVTPALAVDASGNVTAVWGDNHDHNQILYARRFSGGTWAAAVTLLTETNNGTHAQLSVDAAGDVLCAAETDMGIMATIYSAASSSWSAATRLDTSAQTGSSPAAAMDVRGGATVLYLSDLGSGAVGGSVYASHVASGSSAWSTGTAISVADSAQGDDVDSPVVVGDSSGNAVAVWHQYTQATNKDSINTARLSGGSWSAASVLSADAGQGVPLLFIDSTDNVTLLYGAASSRATAGGQLSAPTPYLMLAASVAGAISTNGDIGVLWGDVLHGPTPAFTRYHAGSWSTSIDFSPATTPFSGGVVALAGNGKATAAWLQLNGTAFSLVSAHEN